MEYEQLIKKIQELEEKVKALENSTTIPYPVEQAFRTRFQLADLTPLTSSSKAASTETQAVSEAGAGSYSVAKPMDGFKELVVDGTTFYIPYYEL